MTALSLYRVEVEFDGRFGTYHVRARNKSSARHAAYVESGAGECGFSYMDFSKLVRSIRKVDRIPPTKGQREADEWNVLHPVGTTVRYWPGAREGLGTLSKTRGPARATSPEHGSVHVEGHASCIALSHVECIDPTAEPGYVAALATMTAERDRLRAQVEYLNDPRAAEFHASMRRVIAIEGP